MKILVVTHTFLPVVGGAEIGIHEIYSRIGKKHEVYILTPKLKRNVIQQYGAEDDFFKNTSYKVIHFNNSIKVPQRLYNFLAGILPPFSLSMAFAVFKCVAKIKPDIVNFNFFIHTGLAIVFLRLLTKIPIVLSLVGREDALWEGTPLFWKIYLRFIIKIPNVVISNSKWYMANQNLKNEKIIPYGVDINKYTPWLSGSLIRKKLGIHESQPVFFALQRLSKEKKVDVVITAMKYVLDELSDSILIIGGKGPEEDNLKKLVYNMGLQKHVIFVGYIPETDLPFFFACSDLFILHSTFETFGVVFAQAFASGKPVVSVRNSCIPEIVEDGKDGILVKTNDPEMMANAIVKLIKDRNLYNRIKENVRMKAVKFFDWDRIADKYEKVFLSLIKHENTLSC